VLRANLNYMGTLLLLLAFIVSFQVNRVLGAAAADFYCALVLLLV
jgi:hypothetical protein